jgi:hypothetical protein
MLHDRRLSREFRTLEGMVGLYCRDHHHPSDAQVPPLALCDSCSQFLDYARVRLEKCPYGGEKPTCAKCPVHCYKAAPRATARQIMRYAGPRMARRHPWLALCHILDGFRRVEHPMARRRRRIKRPSP